MSEVSQRRRALVTGASSGIGEAFAQELAGGGFDLVVTGRREPMLVRLAERLAAQHGAHVEVITCDFAEPGAVAALCARIEALGFSIDALVNCAGFGVPGRFGEPEWATHRAMLDVMVTAPTELLFRLLPGMLERRSGLILNVASLAGLADVGAGALYSAAKTFLVTLSNSLAREVAKGGVRVTVVCPGLTRTEFHVRADMRATVAGIPGWMWMNPTTVARQGLAAALTGRTLVVTGGQNRLFLALARYAPRRILSRGGKAVVRLYRHTSRSRGSRRDEA